MMDKKIKIFAVMMTVLLVSLGCGQISVGVEQQDILGSSNGENTPADSLVEDPPVQETTPEPVPSEYWVELQDPNHGFRFAVPCFWTVDFPNFTGNTAEELAQFSYSLVNYPPEYPLSFPRSHIPEENGAIKVDFRMISLPFAGLPDETGLREYIAWEAEQAAPDDTSEVVLIDDVELKGTEAVVVMLDSDGQASKYYLLRISPEFLMAVYAYPSSKILDSIDLQGVLNSITVDAADAVLIPSHTPAAPPIGLAAACIPEYAEAVEPVVEIPEGNTACGLYSFESLDFLTGKVAEYLQARNTGGIRWEYLANDPFVFRPWGGESETWNGDMLFTKLANELYAAGEPGPMSFITDRTQFPPLGGAAPESLLGPGVTFVEVLYSEGWGTDQQGAALLYFALDECGGYSWYGLVFSPTHFDK